MLNHVPDSCGPERKWITMQYTRDEGHRAYIECQSEDDWCAVVGPDSSPCKLHCVIYGLYR